MAFEGPDAESVPELMQELVESLNAGDVESSIIKAAMAHLNLVLIHPFSGRASERLNVAGLRSPRRQLRVKEEVGGVSGLRSAVGREYIRLLG